RCLPSRRNTLTQGERSISLITSLGLVLRRCARPAGPSMRSNLTLHHVYAWTNLTPTRRRVPLHSVGRAPRSSALYTTVRVIGGPVLRSPFCRSRWSPRARLLLPVLLSLA